MPRYSIRWLDDYILVEATFTAEEAWQHAQYLSAVGTVVVINEDTGSVAVVKNGRVL